MLSIIVAIANNHVIGGNNTLLWHISNDLKRFKQLTSGHTVVMGRKTYESLPFKPLKGRTNIVISRTATFDGTIAARNIDEALAQAKATGDNEVFVIGGEEIYKQLMPLADKLYITQVMHDFNGDAFFPEIDNTWAIEEQSEMQHDDNANLDYYFINYVKK
ncbi:MAG: dihydrofolate reductase [Bacteroidales bacterium]|nr:dihydrofolate reductase [Bacteroidales bacterium]